MQEHYGNIKIDPNEGWDGEVFTCTEVGYTPGLFNEREDAANAALIVRAVNSHYGLVEAIRSIIHNGNPDCGTYWKIDSSDIEKARAALRKAGVE